MANIKIDNLQSAGSTLLTDSESYLTELNQDELNIQGGITPMVTTPLITATIRTVKVASGKKPSR